MSEYLKKTFNKTFQERPGFVAIPGGKPLICPFADLSYSEMCETYRDKTAKITGFRNIINGQIMSEPTEAYISYNKNGFFVTVVCHDSHIDKIKIEQHNSNPFLLLDYNI